MRFAQAGIRLDQFSYFELPDQPALNDLYSCLNTYIVASRYEGGPQGLIECGLTKTMVYSSDCGIASQVFQQVPSKWDASSPFKYAGIPNVEHMHPSLMMPKYREMLEGLTR